jgi:hypothetical protein
MAAMERPGQHRHVEMTPIITLPPEAVTPTRGVPVTMVVNMRPLRASEPTEDAVELDYWPEGIDYDKWAPIARPASGGAFANPLDFLDLPED